MSKMTLNIGIKNLKRCTNINDIDVPQKLRDRKKAGITWFDDAIGGEGFVPSSVMMLTGTPGAGKTTLLLQMANAITAAGHICLYNTGEESLFQVKMVADRLALRAGFVVGQDICIQDLLAHANFLQAAHPGKQVFILQDSLQTLNDGKWGDVSNTMTPMRCTELLTDWAKSTYGVVIFIGQVTKSGHFLGKNGILHAVDVHAHLFIDNKKKSESHGERLFEVTKNRFGTSGATHILGMGRTGLYEKAAVA